MNKKKIINDPVYGFITLPHDIIYDLIEHPYFQRLRNISQLGLTSLVYPGALHTRFHHAIGAMHLMSLALNVLNQKGIAISKAERKAVTVAILLHDIGHGPFSHALETALVKDISHEDITLILMNRLNKEFAGKLDTAIEIFSNQYKHEYLHQLVSSQLDVDRMDYLTRDSFYTGVSEGIIGVDRILNMLYVKDDELVVEYKAIYSIEKFIVARRLMYWQVYLHKTVLSAEKLLVNILKRAKYLAKQGEALFASPSLHFFLYQTVGKDNFETEEALNHFITLDDHDFFTSIKVWKNHKDKVLSKLCDMLISRNLYKIEIESGKISKEKEANLSAEVQKLWGFNEEEASYFVFTGSVVNNAYDIQHEKIKVYQKSGKVTEIADASDNLNLRSLSTPVQKHFICYPQLNEKGNKN